MRTLHVGLRIADLGRSLAFYGALGYGVVGTVPETELGSLTMLKLPGDEFVSLELVHDPESGEIRPRGLDHLVIKVESMTATLDALAAQGVTAEPPSSPDGSDDFWTAWLTDPDGYRIELVQWPAGHADGMSESDFAGSGGGSDHLMPSEEVADLARAVLDEVNALLRRLHIEGSLELTGGSSTPGALTKGDIDLHLRVDPERFGAVLERLDEALSRINLHAWADTLAVYGVEGDRPVELAVTPVGSEHDRRFRLAWQRLRSEPTLLAEYNGLKRAAAGTSRYDSHKSDFFTRITTP